MVMELSMETKRMVFDVIVEAIRGRGLNKIPVEEIKLDSWFMSDIGINRLPDFYGLIREIGERLVPKLTIPDAAIRDLRIGQVRLAVEYFGRRIA